MRDWHEGFALHVLSEVGMHIGENGRQDGVW